MLPATTRKQLRIPHHVAILCAGLSLACAFFLDLTHTETTPHPSSVQQTLMDVTSQEMPAEQPSKTHRATFSLPRLFPWAPHRPKSE